MKKFILFLFTIVITDPYKGLRYDRVNVYYFSIDTSVQEYSFKDSSVEDSIKIKKDEPIAELSFDPSFLNNYYTDSECDEDCQSEDEPSPF